MRPSGIGPPAPRCVRKRLALGFLLTVAQYYKIKMGSVFSCSKPDPLQSLKPPHPGLIPGPLWLPHTTSGLALWEHAV